MPPCLRSSSKWVYTLEDHRKLTDEGMDTIESVWFSPTDWKACIYWPASAALRPAFSAFEVRTKTLVREMPLHNFPFAIGGILS